MMEEASLEPRCHVYRNETKMESNSCSMEWISPNTAYQVFNFSHEAANGRTSSIAQAVLSALSCAYFSNATQTDDDDDDDDDDAAGANVKHAD